MLLVQGPQFEKHCSKRYLLIFSGGKRSEVTRGIEEARNNFLTLMKISGLALPVHIFKGSLFLLGGLQFLFLFFYVGRS